MELREPKRKRNVKVPRSQPFPVLIESESGIAACNSLWPVYIGTFSGDCVIINTSDEMTSLYNMGFFGKGSLSRGYPNFETVRNGVAPLVTERQWKRRKLWIDQLLSFTDSSCVENTKTSEKDRDQNTTGSTGDNSAENPTATDFGYVLEVTDDESDDCDSNQQTVKSIDLRVTRSDGKQADKPERALFVTDQAGPSHQTCFNHKEIENKSNRNSHQHNQDAILQTTESITRNVVLGSSYCEGESSSSCLSQVNVNQIDVNSVVVIDDIGSDDECQPESLRPRLCEELIKTTVETLNLTFEEAFFLSFGLGCLQVVNLQGVFLSLQGMWHLYRESQLNFISSYVTYHYFRSKGWIVKPGTKFGGDFLLYKEGPPFYHASYVVLIEEANNKFDNLKNKRQLTWTKIMGLNRIVETANKEVLISHVVWPSDITTEDLEDPRVISKFQVQEVLLRRWNSSHEREGKETT